jgi:hypothetical protein
LWDTVIKKRGNEDIMRDFALRRGRQHLAIAVTLFLLLFLTLLYSRPNLLGELSKNNAIAAQIVVIAAFICFSAYNWRCPSCDKYLGADINRRSCKGCGTMLQ